MKRFLILVAVLVAVPSQAWGDGSVGFGATSARVANNPTLTQLRDLAVKYWAARGIAVPPGRIFLLDRCDCGAYTAGTDMYVPTQPVGWVQSHPSWTGPARELCGAVVHEAGHAGGLAHTPTGVMAADVDHPSLANIPWECRVWARNRQQALSAR